MIPKSFEYIAPGSVDEALLLLRQNDEARVLAGGQSLLPLMKLRVAAPSILVDISKLSGLRYVPDSGDHLAIGALTSHDTIAWDRTVQEKFSLVNDAVARVGDQQIRNLGTIGGGSACHADPAADLPTALLAADARFVIEGQTGQRVVSAKDFFVDVFVTAVRHDEILTEIRLPYLPLRSSSACIKHSPREADFAIGIAAVTLTMGSENACGDVRIAIGAAGPTPLRAGPAEQYLKGRTADESAIAEASERAVEGIDPPSDVHGSREYRIEVAKVLTRRSLRLALSRVK